MARRGGAENKAGGQLVTIEVVRYGGRGIVGKESYRVSVGAAIETAREEARHGAAIVRDLNGKAINHFGSLVPLPVEARRRIYKDEEEHEKEKKKGGGRKKGIGDFWRRR